MSEVNVGDHFDDLRCTHSLRTLHVLAVEGDVATVRVSRLGRRPRGNARRDRLARIATSRLLSPRFAPVPF